MIHKFFSTHFCLLAKQHPIFPQPSDVMKPSQPQVVLTTGAMNPPHKGHAQLLHQAKERLEAAGFQVRSRK